MQVLEDEHEILDAVEQNRLENEMEILRNKVVTENVGSIYLTLRSGYLFGHLCVFLEEMLIIIVDTSLLKQQQQDLTAIESCFRSLFSEDNEEDKL